MHIFTSASFSLLRADLAESSPTPSPQTTSTPSKKTPIGAIAGGAAGGAVVVIAFVIILLICLRRKKGVRRTPTTDLLGLGKGSERPVSYLPQTENDMLLRPTPVRSPSSSPPSSSSLSAYLRCCLADRRARNGRLVSNERFFGLREL